MAQTDSARDTWYQRHRDELFVALQRLLPHHASSRLLGRIAACRQPWLKNRLIRLAIRHYGVDLAEAAIEDYRRYASFNDFFTRRLKPSARPVDSDPHAFVSPADGTISQLGGIREGEIFQAKGHHYSASSLLGGNYRAAAFGRGSFFTLYLSPRDYHRVHMPAAGKITETLYIPGKLFSVNATTTESIDRLFARNERLVCFIDTAYGKIALVMVGALFVAGIETVWQKHYRPGRLQHRVFDAPIELRKGDELGLFRFGSTVIVLTENPIPWRQELQPSGTCKMGETLGTFS